MNTGTVDEAVDMLGFKLDTGAGEQGDLVYDFHDSMFSHYWYLRAGDEEITVRLSDHSQGPGGYTREDPFTHQFTSYAEADVDLRKSDRLRAKGVAKRIQEAFARRGVLLDMRGPSEYSVVQHHIPRMLRRARSAQEAVEIVQRALPQYDVRLDEESSGGMLVLVDAYDRRTKKPVYRIQHWLGR